MRLMSLMCPSLRRATTVLRLVSVSSKYKNRVDVKVFSNCHEQGYHVRVAGAPGNLDYLNLWFAENRNSDQMVLYHGNGYRDEPCGQDWETRQYFRSVEALASEVLKQINTYLKGVK